jgi:signal transduction histidine kinase/ActR/RegA family two-component response regulator
LKRSELRQFIDSAPNVAALLDEDMRYIAASAGWLETHRLTRGIIGASHYDAFPDLPDEWRARHRRVLAGESFKAEREHRTPREARPQWLNWDMRPWRLPDSRIGGVLVVFEHGAELKKRDAELDESLRKLALQAEEMKALAAAAATANKAKTAFVAAMSHEIRTPLNAVVGFAELIANSSDAETIKSYAATLRGSARQLNAIVNDILDFTRLEAGGVALREAPFDLDDLAAPAYSNLKRLVGDKPIALTFVREPGLPQALVGDFGRVMQILHNLLGNAAKFTQRGSISFRISRQASSSPRALIRFEAIDSGPGVGDEVRARLFQAFEQGETIERARADGTGLGLAISRRLAQLMGGEIDLETEEGTGSRFWFEAPFEIAESAAVESSANSAAVPSARAAERSLEILVVEDTTPSRMLLRIMLEARGHWIAEAENGAAAVEAAQGRRFDLILMDVQMPVMDGMAAARLIRKLPEPAASTPIVAVTANACEDQRLKCGQAGIDDVIVKPFTDDALCAVLARWGGEGARRTAVGAPR